MVLRKTKAKSSPQFSTKLSKANRDYSKCDILDKSSPSAQRKNPTVAALLSVLLAGAGQIYNGEVGKGILFFILAVVLIKVVVWWVSLIFWIYVVYDALHTAKKINRNVLKAHSHSQLALI